MHAVPISDKVRKRHEGTFNEPQRASPLVARPLRKNYGGTGFPAVPARAFAGGSMAPPVPAVIMRKIHLILLVLLSGLCLACQPDPSKARLERVLTASWQSYCRHFIKSDGQVIIPEEGGGTISEAQAYALLRAVWANDATVFNRVYAWTYENLSRARAHGDSLLAWRWGRLPDGSWGVLDANSATDGDLDYALALVLAHRKGWRAPPGLPDYREEARRVQADILAKEVVALPDGELLLTPGNWHEPAAALPGEPLVFFSGRVSSVCPGRLRGNGAVRETVQGGRSHLPPP